MELKVRQIAEAFNSHQMRLTIAETETLNYYMAGLGFVEIAQIQNVNNTTVWRRRKNIQKKYLRYVVMQG